MQTHIRLIALCAALTPALLAFAPVPEDSSSPQERKQAAALFVSACSACHLPPDPAHATDRAWLNQVTDTAWSSTPPKARAALIDYLRGTPLALPQAVTARRASLDAGLGTVTPSFERGELLLVNEEGAAFRLSWTGKERDAERARALPAGTYVLRTYRIAREEDDELWHVSATRATIQEVEVEAGANVLVEIDASIRMASRLRGTQAQMTIQGQNKAGLSIYRDGKRIPIDYRVLGEGGSLLASGRMRYGWGGGGWAPLESRAGRIELVYDTPPFEVVGLP